MLSTIYNSHFGFRDSPFGLTPDPRFFYSNAIYREALASLAYGLEAHKGFIVVTGETGTGKTTLLRKLLCDIAPEFKTAYIFNTIVSFTNLLRLILTDLGLQTCLDDKIEMIDRLNEYLLKQHKEGRTVALLIDEAQDLSVENLEELRLLTNLETDKDKLLQIALIGQPELERKLSEPSLRQLNQRVALRCRLTPLASTEVGSYIDFRLHSVAQRKFDLFDRDAVEKIFLYTKGIPRLINIICDNALLMSYSVSKTKIDGKMIDDVASDLLLTQFNGGLGLTAPLTNEQPAKNDFSRSIRTTNTEHAATETQVQVDRAGILINIADSPVEFHNQNSRQWRQITALLTIIFIGLGALLFSQKMGFSTRDTSKIEAPVTHNDTDYAKVPGYARQGNTNTTEPQIQIPVSHIAQPRNSNPNPPLHDIVKFGLTDSNESQSAHSRSADDKQAKNSIGNFDVIDATFVRNQPSSSADIIATLEPGTRVHISARNGDYYQVRSEGEESIHGYVHLEDAFFERTR